MENNENLAQKLDPKFRTFFVLNETLHSDENETIEYKNYQTFPVLEDCLVETLKKAVCGFLNHKGGRIYIGVNDNKEVKGIYLTDKNQDIAKNFVQNLTAHFYPKCRTEKIRIDIVPIRDDKGEYIFNQFIVKIIVKQGDTDKLYSITDRQYYSTLRLNGLVQTLYCEEIIKEIYKRNSQPKEPIPESEFDDIQPIKPVFSDKEIIKSKDNYYLKPKHDTSNNTPLYNVKDFAANASNPKEADNGRSENPFLQGLQIGQKRNYKDLVDKENSDVAQISITNLDSSATVQDLESLFKKYELYGSDPITIMNPWFNSKLTSVAYVKLKSVEEAIKAKSQLESVLFKDKKLNVKII
jgi:hypothetical protein